MSWNKCFRRFLDKVDVKILVIIISIFPVTSFAENWEVTAKQAFYEIEADPFNNTNMDNSAKKIASALGNDPENPWVLIAVSRLILEAGYIKGDRSRMSTYSPGTVEESGRYAREALKHGNGNGMAHVQFSKIQMINGDLKGAWLTLNRAHGINPDDFYPWYYRAVISVRMKDFKKADSYLNEAEERAAQHYQESWVAARRISVAKLIGDEVGIDSAYKKSIEVDPLSPHKYGNYANYLKRKKRYKEAIDYYQKAISISPYPIALKGIEEARQLLSSSAN